MSKLYSKVETVAAELMFIAHTAANAGTGPDLNNMPPLIRAYWLDCARQLIEEINETKASGEDKEVELPTWHKCYVNVNEGKTNNLETFIFKYEPSGKEYSDKFRKLLLATLNNPSGVPDNGDA